MKVILLVFIIMLGIEFTVGEWLRLVFRLFRCRANCYTQLEQVKHRVRSILQEEENGFVNCVPKLSKIFKYYFCDYGIKVAYSIR